MIKILSWDCAYKSLAYTYMYMDLEKINNLIAILNNTTHQLANILQKIENNENYDSRCLYEIYKSLCAIDQQLRDHDVYQFDINIADVLCNNKVDSLTEVSRSIYFKKWMSNFKHRDLQNATILIEHQPIKLSNIANNNIATTLSSVIANQLLYHYINDTNTVLYMDPKLKNFDLYADIKFADYVAKYKTKYIARKKHAHDNFCRIMAANNIPINHLAVDTLHNIADSYMQMLAYFRYEKYKKIITI
jgi:hypothetical protein